MSSGRFLWSVQIYFIHSQRVATRFKQKHFLERVRESEAKGLMNQHVDKIINKLIKLIYVWLISLRIIGLGIKHGMKSSVMMKMDSSRFDEK